MINVTLATNDGDGRPKVIPMVEGVTLGDFLKFVFEGDREDVVIRVRSNGENVEADDDYTLEDGDRVSISPVKIEGASVASIYKITL